MSKKTKQPQLLTISFNEGKQRVSEMITEIFDSMASDVITDLQEARSLKYDADRLELLSESLQQTIREHDGLQDDLEKCYCLGDIVDLGTKYDIFSGCEEQLVGAFLGQTIIVEE